MLAAWLVTFFGKAVTSCFLCGWVMTAESNFLLPRIFIALPLFPAWSLHLYFLPGYWPISILLKYN